MCLPKPKLLKVVHLFYGMSTFYRPIKGFVKGASSSAEFAHLPYARHGERSLRAKYAVVRFLRNYVTLFAEARRTTSPQGVR